MESVVVYGACLRYTFFGACEETVGHNWAEALKAECDVLVRLVFRARDSD